MTEEEASEQGGAGEVWSAASSPGTAQWLPPLATGLGDPLDKALLRRCRPPGV